MTRTVRPQTIVFSFLMLGIALFLAPSARAATANNWAFPDRHYRTAVDIAANGYARSDKVTEINIDFAALLSDYSETGSFDESSLRVTEIDGSGNVIDNNVVFQFDNGSIDTPQGTLLILLSGNTAVNATRTYHIYFDITGTYSQPNFADRVVLTGDDIPYHGKASFVIETFDSNATTRNTTYYYHKPGGAFASLIDRDGNDWISYDDTINSKSGGEYRGIPNMGVVFHPGYSGTSSSIVEDGPLMLTIRSVRTLNGNKWEVQWNIFPTYARMTIVQVPTGEKYWLLYEGTPGGNLDYSGTNQDQIIRSDQLTNNAGKKWNDTGVNIPQELSPEWLYVQDAATSRYLFLIHSDDDAHPDSYRYQYDATQNPPSGTMDNGAMTVLGFGRKIETGVTRYLDAENVTFTLGLGESGNFTAVSKVINGAYQDVTYTFVNEAPTVDINQSLAVNEGATAVLNASKLTSSDPEGVNVTYTLTALTTHGTLKRNSTVLAVSDEFTQQDIATGLIAYTNNGDENSSDSFTFAISDGEQSSGGHTFTFTINPVNDAPVAQADSFTVAAGVLTSLDVLANDSDPDSTNLTVTIVTKPAHGTAVAQADGSIQYKAGITYEGSDSITYRVSDGSKTSNTVTVSLTVEPAQHLFLPLIIR